MQDILLEQDNKRCVSRVKCHVNARLVTTIGRLPHPVRVLDISSNGALASLLQPHNLAVGEEIMLNIDMGDGQQIKMMGNLAHQENNRLGLSCRAISMDNQKRLKDLLNDNDTDH